MAFLPSPVTPGFPDVYQLETLDRVKGGPGGMANLQATQLVERTAFLKKQIDDAVSGALKVMYASRLTTARTITMTGDGSWGVTFDGSGNATAAMTLTNSGVVAGTWPMTTVDSKGRVIAGRALVEADLPALSWAKITSGKPTTLAGYGITDAQPLDSDLTALAALTATGFYVNTGVGTVAARTLTAGAGISISNGDGVAANPVITNTGVTSIAGTANQVNVSAATGGITLSLPQAIHTAAKPSFAQVALAADPVNALDAATKQYVDNVAAGLEVKTSVRAASTANITLSGVQTVDGVALVAGDRVLVKNQSAASQNGIYLVSGGAWTRTTDADAWAELISAFVFVENGTANADTGWVCTVDQGGTLGTTSVSWTQFAGAGTVTAGTGLAVSGNQVSLAAGSNVLALHNLASTGMVVRTGAGTMAARTLTAGAGISVSNGDGFAGNPTFALSASGIAAGTYPKVTVDVYGRATGGAALAAADIPPLDWSKINSGLPTTLAGYGITDAGSGKIIASQFTATRTVVAASGDTTVMTLNFTLAQMTPVIVDWRTWFGSTSATSVYGDARLMLGATSKSRSCRIHVGCSNFGYAFTYPFNGSTYLGSLPAGSYTISIIWNNQTAAAAVFNPGPADSSVWSQSDSEIIVRAAY
jgi:phage-related tail fiber protein